jgi:uncharacterized protein YqgC (DUF456 family)
MSLFISIFKVFFIWGGGTIFLSWIATTFFPGFTAYPLFLFPFVFVYLLLGMTLCYEIVDEVCLKFHKRTAITALVFTCAVFIVLFLAEKYGSNNIFLSIGGSANLLVFATLTGAMLSTAIKRVAELIPISLTAAVADIASVFFGPTKDIAETLGSYYQGGMVGNPPLADFIVIKVSLPGFSYPVPLFGVTDWIILVLLSSSLIRLQKSDNLMERRSLLNQKLFLPVSGCSLMLSVFLAQLFGLFLPALPAMAFIFTSYMMVKYFQELELHRSDMILSVVFPVFVIAAILMAYN